MDKTKKLQELIDSRNPSYRMQKLLTDFAMAEAINEMNIAKGDKGEPGYNPIKGVDYFDGKPGYTPIKGKDYFDGKDGKNGETPTSETLRKIIIPLIPNPIPGPQGIKGNDGKDAPLPELNKLVSLAKEELKKEPIHIKDVKGTEKLIEFLKAGGFRGGGGSSGSVSPLTTKGDLYTYSTVNARLPVGTNGQILSSDSTQITGLKWIAAPTGGSSSIYNEIPSGAVNGVNTVYQTSKVFVTNTTRLFLNGLRQELASGIDYAESSTYTVTFTVPPSVSDVIIIDYESTGASPPLSTFLLQDGSAILIQDGSSLLLN